MASGGARSRSGPAPDPNALRRDRKDDASWTTLPAEGRKGKAPTFPLVDPSPRELVLWSLFWRKPQAVLWEKNGQEFAVAMYVRTFSEAELAEAQTALRTLVRQQAGELLLTIPSMYSARVRIADDEVALARTASTAPKPLSARDRLKVVNGA